MINPYYVPGLSIDLRITRAMNVKLETIEKAVCEVFCLQPEQLRQPTRKAAVAKARQIVFFLAKKYTLKSLADIGVFYIKDHATVFHANRTISNLLETKDKEYSTLIKNAESNMLIKHTS